MNIVLNEKKYAEECLKNGIMTLKPQETLSILAKFLFSMGHKKKQITEILLKFLDNYYPRYLASKNTWIDTVERISKNADKYPLYEFEGVWITKSELDVIDNLKTMKQRKVMFVYLCLAKFYNQRNEKNNNWVNTKMKDIFQAARVQCSVLQRAELRGDLQLLGLLEFPKKNGNLSSRVTFVSNDDNDERILHITDFRELGYAYLRYCGEDYIECASCGILVKNNKYKSRKYCNVCNGSTSKGIIKKVCIDCGKQFEVYYKSNRKIRCDSCQETYRKKYNANKQKEYYSMK